SAHIPLDGEPSACPTRGARRRAPPSRLSAWFVEGVTDMHLHLFSVIALLALLSARPAHADECKRDPIRILFLGTAVGSAEENMKDRVSRELLQWLEVARGKVPDAPYAAVEGTIQFKDREQQYKEFVAIEQNNKTTLGFGRDFYERLGYRGKFC